MKTMQDLAAFASLLEQEQKRAFEQSYPGQDLELRRDAACTVSVKMGKKFARVDVGSSGKYMVDLDTGEIFGIKGYGVVHRGHHYGTLDTIADWKWGGYAAVKRPLQTIPHNDNCDGSGPCNAGEVRVLPMGSNPDHGNLILCRACFTREIGFRCERNKELAAECAFSLPLWDTLEVYGKSVNA